MVAMIEKISGGDTLIAGDKNSFSNFFSATRATGDDEDARDDWKND